MKHTKIIISFLFALSTLLTVNAQDVKPSIGISIPNVNGLQTSPIIAAKLIQLELRKLDKYSVYDEFDMKDITDEKPKFQKNCIGKNCLIEFGEALGVDYMISGSYDGFANKIVLTLKIVDIKNKRVSKSDIQEFDDQEIELQRMTGILLNKLHGIASSQELTDRLNYNDEPITTNNVGKINNSGPRIGYALLNGTMHEFATRPESEGGMEIFPAVSMIGYQLEGQYVGTENFSGLIEGIFNISGLEQGAFIPSLTIMNGFRFGKGGWEFAFGPGFSVKKTSFGFFDTDGTFGNAGAYFSTKDWNEYTNDNYANNPNYINNGTYEQPKPSDFNEKYNFSKRNMDKRGSTQLNTMFVFAFGKTFRAGALNIPVNLFYSAQKNGGMTGVNIGFNVVKKRTDITPSNYRRR
ncbi:MAG: hypothetical protein MK066_07920 [Crocinitomicaceae bacterium]|nr:hypothetical protein [Crocinitomicaceae bacterium]